MKDWELQNQLENARELVVHRALMLQSSRHWAETNNDDPTTGWDIEYREDGLIDAIRQWARLDDAIQARYDKRDTVTLNDGIVIPPSSDTN